jgi:hypothetical protein
MKVLSRSVPAKIAHVSTLPLVFVFAHLIKLAIISLGQIIGFRSVKFYHY